MSDYVREKVLRIPTDKISLSGIKKKVLEKFPEDDDEWIYDVDFAIPDMFAYRSAGKFCFAPTERCFLDYVLETGYDNSGDWGRNRELSFSEARKYSAVFEQIDPNVDMKGVRLVEFCWYNATEAPDYYDNTNDPFYEEV